MTDIDGLFPTPEPEHPDAAVAREEITRYYTDALKAAQEELAKATAAAATAAAKLAAWTDRGELSDEGNYPTINMAAVMVVAHADAAHMEAMRAATPVLGGTASTEGRAAAAAAGERAQALRRWLVAQGYGIGQPVERNR